jgi:hypothetical protein
MVHQGMVQGELPFTKVWISIIDSLGKLLTVLLTVYQNGALRAIVAPSTQRGEFDGFPSRRDFRGCPVNH